MREEVTNAPGRLLECRDCHRLIEAERTVAYHLIDRILYGWCECCFGRRAQPLQGSIELTT